jgi:hypothetical protein
MDRNGRRLHFRHCVWVVGLLCTVSVALGAWNADQDDAKSKSGLKVSMRKKLDASMQILEGLTIEDSDLIQQGAKLLLEISRSERWEMFVDTDYREHSSEFRASVRKILAAAEKNRFDNAAIQWFDTLKGCVECHADVRKERELKGVSGKEKPKGEVPNAKLDQKLDLSLEQFMRQKLEACGNILEGLTSEDSDLVLDGAKTLNEMSKAEKWHVKNDVLYRQLSNEFQRTTKGLVDAAQERKFDTAALRWMDTTMKCLECHRFVRGTRVAGDKK